MSITSRKDDHINLALKDQADRLSGDFDRLSFEHVALPELDLGEIDVATKIFGKNIKAPILISSMTGGGKDSQMINERLAGVAEKFGLPMGLGSQRVMLENPEILKDFEIKKIAPSIVLMANIGAVQLNYGVTPADCVRLVEQVKADALCLHLNPLQEALQPEGDHNFGQLLSKIAEVVKDSSVPVVVKEVGAGISGEIAVRLRDVGVKYIDIAGKGGTSWSWIESQRRGDGERLARIFADWGLSTVDALKQCSGLEGVQIIASGGVRSGLDVSKCIALGASMTGVALPFMRAARVSFEELCELTESLIFELKVAMFCTGSRNLAELSKKQLHEKKY